MTRKSPWLVLIVLSLMLVLSFGCGGSSEGGPETDVTGDTGTEGGEGSTGSESGTTHQIPTEGDESGTTVSAEHEFTAIHFEFDKSRITSGSRGTLTAHGKELLDNPSWTVQIEGHCDERGTVEYNLGLGERRANATKQFLVQYGVSAGRISTISYGKERPLVSGSTEAAWAKNRRCEFRVSR